jgi:hypothetical protein
MICFPTAGSGWLCYSPRLQRIIHTTLAIFPNFQALQVKKDLRKTDVDFLVNQIKLVLGGKPTAELAASKLKAIAKLPVGPEMNLPKNITAALAGKDASTMKKQLSLVYK